MFCDAESYFWPTQGLQQKLGLCDYRCPWHGWAPHPGPAEQGLEDLSLVGLLGAQGGRLILPAEVLVGLTKKQEADRTCLGEVLRMDPKRDL